MISPGTVIGRDYRVLRSLSEGGMGEVFVAEQLSTGRQRALKVMKKELVADAGLRKRFELEARVGSRIASEHVVEVVAAGVCDETGMPFIAMELLEGDDLRARIKARTLTRADLVEVYLQLGDALGAAHASGIVHRDLKPENVFLASSKRSRVLVKVLDFGIARVLSGAMTQQASTSVGLGTPLYMAPEQANPGMQATPATDVWALGLIAFETLTGRAFWNTARAKDATNMMLAVEAYVQPIPPASERARELGVEAYLPPGFDAWFAHCVSRDPTQRYANGRAACESLAHLLSQGAGASLGTTGGAGAPVHGAPVASGAPGFSAPGMTPPPVVETLGGAQATNAAMATTALRRPAASSDARPRSKALVAFAVAASVGVGIGAIAVVAAVAGGRGSHGSATGSSQPGSSVTTAAAVVTAEPTVAPVAPTAEASAPRTAEASATVVPSAASTPTTKTAAPAPTPRTQRPRPGDRPRDGGGVYVPPPKL